MPDIEYESRGVPLEEYQFTPRDHREQQQRDTMRQFVSRQVEEDVAKCRADPEMAARRHQAFENAWKLMQSFKKADHEIMRWRVRLYCGHIAETRRHYESCNPTLHGSSSMDCPECGKESSVIVAFEPIGLVGEPPAAAREELAAPPPPKRPSRAELERRIAQLEKENERLRVPGRID
ncbi:hypothetical protein OG590_17085 [Streptomyces goshikiensis]|uniref:hypothetical protein n=1 Tax=Streptomyces goshikiensis TaxID=1942 RepID=UPI0022F3BB3F|nr:hypothetical protein [Streptomyces goshikiensis]WBY21338.1 hypothetical protein PET44_18025 [Streptomyces goshikiensis]WSX98825.1 hypothetical protein OG590_17085 [Streptomyces goshikiensis]